jgi:RNA polymerase sigma factor (sigma-70 family)
MDLATDGDSHEMDEETEIRHAALQAAIEALPERQAIIMRMRIQGKSLRDIAHLLNRPVGTVSVESSRAMECMRTLLERGGICAAGVNT